MELTDIPYHIAMLLIQLYRGVIWCGLQFLLPYFVADRLRKGKKIGFVPNGPEPFHPQIHDKRLYFRVALDKMLGLGEGYMDGWWDCEQVDEACTRMARAGMFKELMLPSDYVVDYVRFHLFNLQTVKRSWEVAEKHYNIGKEIFLLTEAQVSNCTGLLVPQVTSYSSRSWTHQ